MQIPTGLRKTSSPKPSKPILNSKPTICVAFDAEWPKQSVAILLADDEVKAAFGKFKVDY